MPKELLIYCDESIERGPYYSNFYGSVCVTSEHSDNVIALLSDEELELNLHKEVKWSRVTAS